MKRDEYERLAAAEERMWWFQALHDNLIGGLLAAADAPSRRSVLDAGCGTGGLLRRLGERLPSLDSAGLELDRGAAAVARAKSGRPVCVGSVDRLPFATACFDAIFSADVLCHRGVDEVGALAEFWRCLRRGGILLLNLPAYRWLFSEHDIAVDNARRYGRGEAARLLAGAGFAVTRISYWNTFLFPLMVMRRKLRRRSGGKAASDVALLPETMERLFRAIAAWESRLLGAGIALPFGGSILVVATKR